MEIIDRRIIVPKGTIGRIKSTMIDPIESIEEFNRLFENVDFLADYCKKSATTILTPDGNHAVSITSLDKNTNYIINSYVDSLTITSISAVAETDEVTIILFKTGNTNTFTLNVPNTIEWIDSEVPDLDLDTKYIFAIWHNIAFIKEYGIAQ